MQKEELKKAIKHLSEVITKQNKEEVDIERLNALLEEHGEELLNLSTYHAFVHYPEDTFEDALLRRLLTTKGLVKDIEYDSSKWYKISFIYKNYSLVEKQLDEVIIKYEGRSCSADKTTFILREYIRFVEEGKLPDTWNREDYWVPNNGEIRLWLSFVDNIQWLFFGNTANFLKARTNLITNLENS